MEHVSGTTGIGWVERTINQWKDTMSVTLVRLAVNVVAIAILVLGIYFPRH